ncbi:hypothetical protein [Bifidobacterium avesanii]|nr:hypothetical protein [Bifidobacterium avesanii]
MIGAVIPIAILLIVMNQLFSPVTVAACLNSGTLILLLLGAYLRPKPISIAILCYSVVSTVVFAPAFNMSVVAACIAIGTLIQTGDGMIGRYAFIAELVFINVFYIYNNTASANRILFFNILYSCMLTVTYAVSVSMQWKDRAAQYDGMRHELAIRALHERHQHEQRAIAAKLHDATTGDLTYIILLAQQRHEGCASPAEKDAYAAIERRAESALRNIHEVIGVLNDAATPADQALASNGDHVDRMDSIMRYCRRRDGELAAIGFHGTTTIQGAMPRPRQSDDLAREMEAMLNEIYANIMRHCETSRRDYLITIHFGASAVRLTEINERSDETVGGTGGTGLGHLSEMVRRRHGTVNVIDDDHNWILQLSIPYDRQGTLASPAACPD